MSLKVFSILFFPFGITKKRKPTYQLVYGEGALLVLCDCHCDPCGVKSSLTKRQQSLPVVIKVIVIKLVKVERSCSLVLKIEGKEEREREREREREERGVFGKQCEASGCFQPSGTSRCHPVCVLTRCSHCGVHLREQMTEEPHHKLRKAPSITHTIRISPFKNRLCWSDKIYLTSKRMRRDT